jgi:hypothetical protein
VRSISLTTADAALVSFAYVMATLAPSLASRFAIAAPMREPPVTTHFFSWFRHVISLVSDQRSATSLIQLDWFNLDWFNHLPS